MLIGTCEIITADIAFIRLDMAVISGSEYKTATIFGEEQGGREGGPFFFFCR
jgi:hypothetical protein